jgi:hypothetical protein
MDEFCVDGLSKLKSAVITETVSSGKPEIATFSPAS